MEDKTGEIEKKDMLCLRRDGEVLGAFFFRLRARQKGQQSFDTVFMNQEEHGSVANMKGLNKIGSAIKSN